MLALQQKPDDRSAIETDDALAKSEMVNTKAISGSQAESIFGIITDLKEAGALAKRQLNLDLVISTLRSRYDIDSEDYARDLIIARSGPVLERMDQSEFDWPKKAIYRELKQAAANADIRQIAITPLRPRTSFDEDSSEHEDDDDGKESDDDNSPRARRRRMRMSVLRPSTKKAGKKTRSGKGPAAVGDDTHMSEDSDMGAEDLETPSKTSRGHNLVRDPPPSATPMHTRARSILSDADSTTLVIRKTPLQETYQSANLSGPELSGNHEDSINIDDLPEDTWACSVLGCGKIIYKASSKRSKELINDHNLTHAEDTQTKLNLVFAEQRLNLGLGVDNLLQRIREFGTLDDVPADIGDVAPKRVRR